MGDGVIHVSSPSLLLYCVYWSLTRIMVAFHFFSVFHFSLHLRTTCSLILSSKICYTLKQAKKKIIL